jgi:hypothetical protein
MAATSRRRWPLLQAGQHIFAHGTKLVEPVPGLGLEGRSVLGWLLQPVIDIATSKIVADEISVRFMITTLLLEWHESQDWTMQFASCPPYYPLV